MILSKFPPSIHTAFNPVIVQCTKENEDTAVLKLAVGHVDVIPANYITKECEYFNNTAIFDLSSTLKMLFSNSISQNEKIITDGKLVVKYSVFNDSDVLLFKATALNAVVQTGESSDFTRFKGKILTEFETLKYYDGYAMEVAILGYDDITYILFDDTDYCNTTEKHFFVNTQKASFIQISNNSTTPYLQSNTGKIITTNNALPIEVVDIAGYLSDSKNITPDCVNNPFYVRWINSLGGYDYWMFKYRQYLTRNVSEVQTFSPVITDQSIESGTDKVISMNATEKIKVGASGLTPNEYKVISKLIYSPLIQWFNENLNKWISLTIDKGESEDDTHETAKEIEITFKLPEPQLQF